MNRILLVALFFLPLSFGFGQVGTWQSYTDMKNANAIALDNARLIAATSGGTFFYDINSEEYVKYTIVDGLASINLTSAFIDSKGRIIIGATSGHVNIFEPELGWRTVPDIARSTSRPQRGIRVIAEYKGLLYIGTDFGVTVYDVDADEFRDTFTKFGDLPLNTGVNDLFFQNDSIWVATDKGIGYADLQYENLQDPSQWGAYTASDGLPSATVNALAEFHGNLAAGTESGLVVLESNSWGPSQPPIVEKIMALCNDAEDLYIGLEFEVYKISPNGNRFVGDFLQNGSYQAGTRISDISLHNGKMYIATNYGVGVSEENPDQRLPWNFLYPNGPNSNQFVSLSIDAFGNLWSASGRDGLGQGAYMFDGNAWDNYTKENTPTIPTNDILWSAAAPNGDMWFGTWGQGLLRRDVNGVFSAFNSSTVNGFPGILEDPSYSPIGGIAIDRTGNVFSLHSGSTQKMVSMYSTNGTWNFFGDPTIQGDTNFDGLAIDEFGNKWLIVTKSSKKGLLVFNENGTIADQSDDDWTHVPSGTSSDLLAEDIASLVVDGFGDIWIGANAGIRTIFNPQEPNRVTRTCYNTRCNIEGEAITCLAVDPVNNKWIGTNSGVFVLSNDGSTILFQFNTDNSLLLDNKITSIVVHPTSGVVFIGTNKGLSAYTTPYQKAQAEFTELKIYPNPFKPRTDLEVSIQGLVEESSIKILSISGNLIAEFTTPGGNIGFWDGKTSDGKWAPSGIYYVAAYSADGKKAAVGKVAVINE